MNIAQIISRLKQPVDPNLISQKKVGGKIIDYISWFGYCNLLDERVGLGNWEWSIVNMTTTDNRLFITGKLTIYGDAPQSGTGGERSVSQMATGTEILNCNSYGDPSSNAEAMALRRACAKFGLARNLWRKEEKHNSFKTNKTFNHQGGKTKEITKEQWLQLKNNQ